MGWILVSFLWELTLCKTWNLIPKYRDICIEKGRLGVSTICKWEINSARNLMSHRVLWQSIKPMDINRRMLSRMRKAIVYSAQIVVGILHYILNSKLLKEEKQTKLSSDKNIQNVRIFKNLCHIRNIFQYLVNSMDTRFVFLNFRIWT